MKYDVVIIGAGPAGLTAGIFASRAGLNVACFERLIVGGQASLSSSIENYPGFENITGFDLMQKMLNHATKSGVKSISEDVLELSKTRTNFKIKTKSSEYIARKVIIACGCKARRLNLKREDKLIGKGISYCASCDGMFFKDKTVAVVGGGDSAVENIHYLSRLCKKIYMLNRSERFRANPIEIKKIKKYSNVEVLTNTTVEELVGEKQLEGIKVKINGEYSNIELDGLFVAIGYQPSFEFVKLDVETDEFGYIKVDENQKTNIKNLYACGDVTSKKFKQVITACADGARAGNSCVGD